MIRDLVMKNRSFRRFHEEILIERKSLEDMIDLARMSPSAANLQPLKYMIVNDPETNARVFPNLAWAGYIKDWDGPAEGGRPSAYIVILGDTEISSNFGCDHGICAQSILLGAAEKGLGGCMIGSINRDGLRDVLRISPQYEILLVIALGKPSEKVELETTEAHGDIKYWRDENDVHHVPKRPLDEIIIR